LSFEEALKIELAAVAGLKNKVYPVDAPQSVKPPYLTYESNDLLELKTHDGYGDHGNLECTLEVMESTYAKMKALGGLVKAKIKSFQSRSIGTTGPYIQNVTIADLSPEMYEPNVDLYRKSITFTVFF